MSRVENGFCHTMQRTPFQRAERIDRAISATAALYGKPGRCIAVIKICRRDSKRFFATHHFGFAFELILGEIDTFARKSYQGLF
jgi:hypothetical protein